MKKLKHVSNGHTTLGFATVLPTTAQTNKLLELYIGDTQAYVNAASVKLIHHQSYRILEPWFCKVHQ